MAAKKQKEPLVPSALDKFFIQSIEDDTVFEAYFGDGSPTVTDGYGGWQVTARPKDVGIVEWIGRNPMQIEIPFLIDNWLDDPSDNPGIETERQVSNLESLCGIGGHAMPPPCLVHGNGVIPHDEAIAKGANRWVVENVSWDREREFRSPKSQRRIQCGGTITIRQYIVSTDFLAQFSKYQRAGSKKPHKPYLVKKGDTLHKIAAKVYGDARKWKKIAEANNIRDSRSLKAKVGKRIRIPN
jgi:hypothetical protein